MAFWGLPFSHGPWGMVIYHKGGEGYYMYIYSLRHFLTTKGALIDGDGYPPLPPLKWVKKGSKKCQFSLKNDDEKVSKTVFLNGKIDFFTLFTTINTKID